MNEAPQRLQVTSPSCGVPHIGTKRVKSNNKK